MARVTPSTCSPTRSHKQSRQPAYAPRFYNRVGRQAAIGALQLYHPGPCGPMDHVAFLQIRHWVLHNGAAQQQWLMDCVRGQLARTTQHSSARRDKEQLYFPWPKKLNDRVKPKTDMLQQFSSILWVVYENHIEEHCIQSTCILHGLYLHKFHYVHSANNQNPI